MARVIITLNPNPPYNYYPVSLAWFDATRPRRLGGTLKQTNGGWVFEVWEKDTMGNAKLAEHLAELLAELVVTDEDITDAAGNTVFGEDKDSFFTRCIQRMQEVGNLPLGDEGTAYHVVSSTKLPDDYFLDAWTWERGLTVDMDKAVAIHLKEIRRVRSAELDAKDITFLRAVEAGDTVAQATIATEKQVLRDIPQTFDLTARTPQQLKGKWPIELPPRTA